MRAVMPSEVRPVSAGAPAMRVATGRTIAVPTAVEPAGAVLVRTAPAPAAAAGAGAGWPFGIGTLEAESLLPPKASDAGKGLT